MATVLYSDVNYYGPHFESMAMQWRKFDEALAGAGASIAKYIRDRKAKRYLRGLPEYLLDDIGVDRSKLK